MDQRPTSPNGAEEEESRPEWSETWPPYSYWARVGATLVGVAALAGLFWSLRGILLILVASVVLAIGLQPAIEWFERRGVKRGWGLALVLVGGLVVIGGLLSVLIPFVAGQVSQFIEDLPSLIARIQEEGPPFLSTLIDFTRLDSLLDGNTPEVEGTDIGPLRLLMDLGGSVFSIITVLVVTPYFALEFPGMKSWIVRLLRPKHREDFMRVLGESTDLIANYIVGNLVISLIAGVVAFVGFRVLDIRFALALAAWVAFTDLIPAVGATIGAAGVAAVVSFQGGNKVFAALALLFVYQMLENYLIAPKVMNRAVDLNPATVIVALMVGGSVAGLVGALLALPIAAMAKVVTFQLVVPERLVNVRREAAASGYSTNWSRRRRNLP